MHFILILACIFLLIGTAVLIKGLLHEEEIAYKPIITGAVIIIIGIILLLI